MFTAEEAALWSAEEALHKLRCALPLGWRLTIRGEARYSVAELHDAAGSRRWISSNPDPKFLYLEGLGWLAVRNHKTSHPAWRPRDRDAPLRVPNPISNDPDPPDLDPKEVEAVYKGRR
jgi:hypothetical protein